MDVLWGEGRRSQSSEQASLGAFKSTGGGSLGPWSLPDAQKDKYMRKYMYICIYMYVYIIYIYICEHIRMLI